MIVFGKIPQIRVSVSEENRTWCLIRVVILSQLIWDHFKNIEF